MAVVKEESAPHLKEMCAKELVEEIPNIEGILKQYDWDGNLKINDVCDALYRDSRVSLFSCFINKTYYEGAMIVVNTAHRKDKKGFDVNKQDCYGRPILKAYYSLHECGTSKWLCVINALMNAGAQLTQNLEAPSEQTPLEYILKSKFRETLHQKLENNFFLTGDELLRCFTENPYHRRLLRDLYLQSEPVCEAPIQLDIQSVADLKKFIEDNQHTLPADNIFQVLPRPVCTLIFDYIPPQCIFWFNTKKNNRTLLFSDKFKADITSNLQEFIEKSGKQVLLEELEEDKKKQSQAVQQMQNELSLLRVEFALLKADLKADLAKALETQHRQFETVLGLLKNLVPKPSQQSVSVVASQSKLSTFG